MTLSEVAGYAPNKKAALAYSILYGICAIYHEYQIRLATPTFLLSLLFLTGTSKTKPQRFTTPLSLGGFMSMAGFITRYMAIGKETSYLTLWITSQCLILGAGPAYAGADYFIAARLFHYIPHAASMRPGRVVATFLTFDIMAELLLYVGAIAMLLSKVQVGKDAGLWIFRIAMCLQAVLFLVFVVIVMRFDATVQKKGLKGPWRRIIWTLYASSVLILTRCVYHISGGHLYLPVHFGLELLANKERTESFFPHSSAFRTNEIYFLILEGGIMLVNVGMWNLIHPGFLLPAQSTTYLQEDGTLTEGNDYQDTRPIVMKILDPFDFRGMKMRRREKSLRMGETEMQGLTEERGRY